MKINPKELIKKYRSELEAIDGLEVAATWFSQFDDYSAAINYAVVRELKPKVALEFGARTGRCTYDIQRALTKNGTPFVFKSYEKEEHLRTTAQMNLHEHFANRAIKIGGDILEAKDIPDNIEYLFVDNSHEGPTTKWLFDVLLKKCVPGAIVQIHDIPLTKDFQLKKTNGVFEETIDLLERYKTGTLPLKAIYCASWDTGWESSWWEYQPL